MSNIKEFFKKHISIIFYILFLLIISIFFYLSLFWYILSIVDTENEFKIYIVRNYEIFILVFFILINIIWIFLNIKKKLDIKYLFIFLILYLILYVSFIDTIRLNY